MNADITFESLAILDEMCADDGTVYCDTLTLVSDEALKRILDASDIDRAHIHNLRIALGAAIADYIAEDRNRKTISTSPKQTQTHYDRIRTLSSKLLEAIDNAPENIRNQIVVLPLIADKAFRKDMPTEEQAERRPYEFGPPPEDLESYTDVLSWLIAGAELYEQYGADSSKRGPSKNDALFAWIYPLGFFWEKQCDLKVTFDSEGGDVISPFFAFAEKLLSLSVPWEQKSLKQATRDLRDDKERFFEGERSIMFRGRLLV